MFSVSKFDIRPERSQAHTKNLLVCPYSHGPISADCNLEIGVSSLNAEIFS